jgi:large subunit ribosomal protein L22
MKASLTNYHQPPRKVRLVADLIRGKSVPAARVALSFLDKKSAPAIVKLLDSAVANARFSDENLDVDLLFVKTLTVDKGVTLKRVRPFKQGRAGRLHKIMSTVKMELGTKGVLKPKLVATKSVEAADEKMIGNTGGVTDSKLARKPRATKKTIKSDK